MHLKVVFVLLTTASQCWLMFNSRSDVKAKKDGWRTTTRPQGYRFDYEIKEALIVQENVSAVQGWCYEIWIE